MNLLALSLLAWIGGTLAEVALQEKPSSVADKLNDSDERIVGGSEVPDGGFPYMVAIYFEYEGDISFQCGGSLITQYHVITAGHCVDGWYPERFTVRWSSNHNLASPSSDEQIREVAQTKIFPYFHFIVSTAIPTNDIAILTLSEPLEVADVITLPSQDYVPTPGSTCTIAGWGSLQDGGTLSDVLNQVDVELQEYDTCYSVFGLQMRETMLCAGYPEGGKDACAGDSGGPLICDGVFSGIISWGDGCAEPGKFGVYTNLPIFSDWVEKNNFVLDYPPGSEM